jgi:hypothetical protein
VVCVAGFADRLVALLAGLRDERRIGFHAPNLAARSGASRVGDASNTVVGQHQQMPEVRGRRPEDSIN